MNPLAPIFVPVASGVPLLEQAFGLLKNQVREAKKEQNSKTRTKGQRSEPRSHTQRRDPLTKRNRFGEKIRIGVVTAFTLRVLRQANT